jgi:hypothetical protein
LYVLSLSSLFSINDLEAKKYYEDCFKLGASMPGESLEDVKFVKKFDDFSINNEMKRLAQYR